jgi:hypothetical protein
MPVRSNHIAAIVALALAGSALGGCASMNEKLSAGMGDYIPQWLGGLPPDVPPRRGTPQYDEYMKERERKRLEPAAATADGAKPASPSSPTATPSPAPAASNTSASSAMALDPVH